MASTRQFISHENKEQQPRRWSATAMMLMIMGMMKVTITVMIRMLKDTQTRTQRNHTSIHKADQVHITELANVARTEGLR